MNETNWFHDLTTDEAKEERQTLAQRVIAWLGVVRLLVLVSVATQTHAVEIPVQVLEKDGITIRLMNTPCVDPVSVAAINPAFLARFKGLESVWPEKDGSRKAYAGCWVELKAGESGAFEDGFLVVFSDGESGFIPKTEFKKTRGQVGV